MSVPNPGSVAAQDLGCVCAIGENNCGKGREGKFTVHPECRVHSHVCGLQGYDPYQDPICPGCELVAPVELDPCPRCRELITDDMGHSCREIPARQQPGGWNARAAKAEAVAFGEWLLDELEIRWSAEDYYAEFKESQRG